MNKELRLKILKTSNIYGGFLSLIIVGLYLLFAVGFPGTLRYVLISAILLPLGVVSAVVFLYLHLSYHRAVPEEAACSSLTGSLIISMNVVPGLIIAFFEIQCFSQGFMPPAPLLILFILGDLGLVLGILSIFALLKVNKIVPRGLEWWKIKGLQLSTLILIAGIVVASISTSIGRVGDTKMTYEVMLDTSEETTFFIPLPMNDSNKMVVDIANELKVVEGTADWKIVDTIHGNALEVHTNTKCTLSAEKECGYKGWDEGDEWLYNYNISMLRGIKPNRGMDVYEVWVFASNANTTMRIDLALDDGLNNMLTYISVGSTPIDSYPSGDYIYGVSLKEGWQTVELERSPLMCYD